MLPVSGLEPPGCGEDGSWWLGFPEAAVLDVVCSRANGSLYLEKQPEVEDPAMFDYHLVAKACPGPEESVSLIAQVAAELT